MTDCPPHGDKSSVEATIEPMYLESTSSFTTSDIDYSVPSKFPFSEQLLSHRIKGASLEQLIVKLVVDQDDNDFITSFFTCYCTICHPTKLLENLFDLYKEPYLSFTPGEQDLGSKSKSLPPNIIQMIVDHQTTNPGDQVSLKKLLRSNIITVIKRWMDSNFFDFYDNPSLLESISTFVKQQSKKKRPSTINILTEAKQRYLTNSSLFEARLTYPIVKALHPQAILPILPGKLSPEFIAQQMTVLEYDITRTIRVNDLLEQTKIETERKQLQLYSHHFKNIHKFFIAEIISQPTHRSVQSCLKRAILIAHQCFLYHNYNSVMEIFVALTHPAVSCLEKAWELLDNKYFKILEELNQHFTAEENYRNYRALLRSVPNPCVPFLGAHVGDIRFLCNFNQTLAPSGYNVQKLNLLTKEINQLRSLQGAEYPFSADVEFRTRFIENFCHVTSLMSSVTPCETSGNILTEKSKYLRTLYEETYSGANLFGKDEVGLHVMQLRSRDWAVLTSTAKTETYGTEDVIYEQEIRTNNPYVAFLKKGRVAFRRNGIVLRELKAPSTIGILGILNSIDTSFEVVATSTCSVEWVEERLLSSLLESDSELSLRFFSELSFQLIDQLLASTLFLMRGRSASVARMRNSSSLEAPLAGLLGRHLVVKPNSSGSNPFLALDPKMVRDRKFRQLFDFTADEVLIREFKASLLGKLSAPGILFVSQKHVCFNAKVFNHKTKLRIQLEHITNISQKKNKVTLERRTGKPVVIRVREPDLSDFVSLLQNLLGPTDGASKNNTSAIPVNLENNSYSLEQWREKRKENLGLGLSHEDWKIILRGSKRFVCSKDTVIVEQGAEFQRVFHVIRGNCRFEKTSQDGSPPVVVGSTSSNHIFGEVSFVQKRGAAVAVIADSEEVELCVIEGYFFNRLLLIRPELAGRFLHYICCVLQMRVNQNDRFENEEERKVIDLISEPLHHNLVKHPVLPVTDLNIVITLDGPALDEGEEAENKERTKTPFCCGTAVTTYPMLPVQDLAEGEAPRFSREGSPICDQYKCCIFPSRIIMAVADGCNWGDPPRNAARASLNAFVRYLSNHQTEIGDLQYAGRLVLRALSMANAEIFKGIDTEKSMVGTTTLLGGIVLELDLGEDLEDVEEDSETNYGDEDLSAHVSPSSSGLAASRPSYGFVYVSIGDCKAFHWSAVTKTFSDITASNRTGTLSASDCGGRLGPHNEGNLPDLRNLELGFFACHKGDVIILVSDGVHDNLDPAHLGFNPRDFDIDADRWDAVPDFEAVEEIKNEYRIELLEKVIFGELDSATNKREVETRQNRELPPPIEIVNNITSYCIETCTASASWMAANPRGRLPKDYRLYPGKMDHTTCVCVKVGEIL